MQTEDRDVQVLRQVRHEMLRQARLLHGEKVRCSIRSEVRSKVRGQKRSEVRGQMRGKMRA